MVWATSRWFSLNSAPALEGAQWHRSGILGRPGWGGENEAALGWPGLLELEGSDSIGWCCWIICCLYKGPQGLVSEEWVRGPGFMQEDSILGGDCFAKSPHWPGAPIAHSWHCLDTPHIPGQITATPVAPVSSRQEG